MCEWNSKKSPRDERGYVVGGREPERRKEEHGGVEAHSQKIALRARD